MPARTVALWCADWPLVAAGIDGTEIAAAVLRANRVVAASVGARAEGVRRGMRRREAQARCPELELFPYDPEGEARAFEPIAAAIEADLCPDIDLIRPGLLAFAARGPSRFFGGEASVGERARSLARHAASSGAAAQGGADGDVRVGVATGRFAATLAARAATPEAPVLVVPDAETAAFLSPHPVAVLDRPELVDLFGRLGLRTLGDVTKMPVAKMGARFGPEGVEVHRLASGRDEQALGVRTPPLDLTVVDELDPPSERLDQVAFVAKALADRLYGELTAKGLACTALLIEAETEHGEVRSRRWRHDGALSATAIAERVRWQLDGWLNAGVWGDRPTAGVARLRLTPEAVRPDHGRQGGFWGPTGGLAHTEADERATRALARVQGLLGIEAVGTLTLAGGRSPAERSRFVPWGDAREQIPPTALGRPVARHERTPPWPGRLPTLAASLVHDPPLPAEVVDAEGQPVRVGLRSGVTAAPSAFSAGGGPWLAVERWAGPWFVEERWWDAVSHQRMARFQLVVADGQAWLLLTARGRWWIEATYD